MTEQQTLILTVAPDQTVELQAAPECPPHHFEAAWATPLDATSHDDTVPGLYCTACGEIRPFAIPDYRIPEE